MTADMKLKIYFLALITSLFCFQSLAQSVVTNRFGQELSIGSNFYLSGGTTDAGIDKTNSIYRMGKLGIGISLPLQRLHIGGQIQIDTLNSGASTDSLLTANSSGLVRRLSFSNAMKFFPNVSSSIVGIVNNTSGQELGGVDKKINSVDIGKGGGAITSNTRVGVTALNNNSTGTNNSALGFQTLLNNTTGSHNTGLGNQSLGYNTGGNYNVGVGSQSLTNQTTASSNTAIGYNTGNAITTSSQNVAIGTDALSTNVSSGNNVAIGAYSLDLATSGNNTAVGYNSGKLMTTGAGNTILGYRTGENVTTGGNNMILGANGGSAITTGSGNISLGNSNLTTGSNNTIIGGTTTSINIGAAYKSEIIALANGKGSVRVFADSLGQVGIGTITPLNKLVVKGVNAAVSANGTAQSNATFRVDGDTNHALDMGTLSASPFGSYIQSYNKASTGSLPLALNPSGGNVGVNIINPLTTLHVNSTLAATNTVNADASVLRLARPTTPNIKWDNIALFNLGAYSAATASANSRLDLGLNDGSTTTTSNIMTWLAKGTVGINNTNPSVPIDVNAIGSNQYLPIARFLAPSNAIAGNNSQMVFGTSQGAGNCSDWRFYYAGNASSNNRIDFGMSGRVTPMISYLYNGYTGINNTTPLSFLDVSGSFGTIVRGSSVSTTTSGDHTIWMAIAGTICTLESPTAVTRRIMVIKNTSSGTISVTGHIDGTASSTLVLLSKESIQIQSDGTTWQIIAKYDSPSPIAVSTQLNPVDIPTATNTSLTSYTNVSDTSNGAWSPSTGVFTCNKAGLYRFEFRAMFASASWTQGNEVNAQFFKNNTNVQSASWFAASTYTQYAFSGHNFATFNLAVGDQIKVVIWHNAGSSRTTYLKQYSTLSIYEIR
jgi:hypothetical protein